MEFVKKTIQNVILFHKGTELDPYSTCFSLIESSQLEPSP